MKSCFRGHPLEIRQFQTVYLQKRSNLCGPPRQFPRSAKHSRRGREGFPAEKTGAGVPNLRPVFFGVIPLKSDGLPPTPGKTRGPPRYFPRVAKHSRRGREGFPAEKTDAGTQNWSLVFRGRPPGTRRFASKNGQILRAPPPLSEGRKTLTPRVGGFPS